MIQEAGQNTKSTLDMGVPEPNSGLPRFCFLRWIDGPAPVSPRCTAPSHSYDGPPDKQGNNSSGFVAVVGLIVWNIVQYQGRIRPWNSAGSLDLKGKMGGRTLPAPDPVLISNGSLRRKLKACNQSASVIRLFIRNDPSAIPGASP